ncbi:glycosyltransferase involved in cell wall biosynthesis [Bradyrhizobium sp. USDA 4509]
MTTILFARAMPLNVTPAVERYVKFLRENGFSGTIVGAELDTGSSRTPADFVDELYTSRGSFEGLRRRAQALAAYQAFLVRTVARVRPDIVQFCDVFSAVAGITSKLFGSPHLIFDIRDPVKLSTSHYGPLVPRALHFLESLAARVSDGIIVVSPELMDFVPQAARKRAVVMTNSPEEDQFTGYQFSGGDNITISLSGFVSYRRNLDAWCRLVGDDPKLKLDLYGTIADERSRQILDQYGFEQVNRVSHEEALSRSRAADIMALTYDPSIVVNQFAAPNKFFEGLMLGKPSICSTGMRLGERLAREHCGIVVRYGDVAELATAVETLREPAERRRMGENARRLFEREYLGQARNAMRTLYGRLGLIPM